MPEPAGGVPTFLFTDVEGSTRLIRQLGDGYVAVQAEHQRLLRDAFSAHKGREIDTQGDSFFVEFRHPRDAVDAAVAAQRALSAHDWPAGVGLRVRIGIHTGPAQVAGDRYVGLAVHRAARICAAGHGGQVLLSETTAGLLEDEQDLDTVELRDLGRIEIKDFHRPVRIFQVVASGLPEEFAPLRSLETALVDRGADLVRASDQDRERIVAILREASVDGRLTLEEFSERTEAAYAATTLGELEPLVDTLARVPARAARRHKRFTVAALGNIQRSGRWRLHGRHTAFVGFGDLDLDLREAELDGPVATITAFVLFGNVDVYAPEGIDVDLGGFSAIGHRREWGRDVPPMPGTPLVRVNVFSLFGTADLWRVPLAWAGRAFGEVIEGLRSGAVNQLPPGKPNGP